MSMYCNIKTQFKNRAALIAALMETGHWTAEQIEVHDERDEAPYTGTRDDGKRVDAIVQRISSLGGVHLVWS